MTTKEMETLIIASLGDFLRSKNREVPEMESDTDPICDLGLDSLDGVAWCCDLEERGLVVPDNINPFRDSKDKPDGSFKHRTIREIADLLCRFQKTNSRSMK